MKFLDQKTPSLLLFNEIHPSLPRISWVLKIRWKPCSAARVTWAAGYRADNDRQNARDRFPPIVPTFALCHGKWTGNQEICRAMARARADFTGARKGRARTVPLLAPRARPACADRLPSGRRADRSARVYPRGFSPPFSKSFFLPRGCTRGFHAIFCTEGGGILFYYARLCNRYRIARLDRNRRRGAADHLNRLETSVRCEF